jgi:carboxymethylenebutenolidase
MRDDDRLIDQADPQFGSGVVGVCDVCGTRQAIIVLSKERFKLCVIDFLNKAWTKTDKKPGAPAPLYRSERIWFDSRAAKGGRAPAIVLRPTKVVKHPAVLVTPDVFGITTTLLDGAIRLAREGFEVLLPDLSKTDGIGPATHVALRSGARFRGGVAVGSKKVAGLLQLYEDALDALLAREMIDRSKAAVFGTSYGASLALALAAQSTKLTAVALAYPMPVSPAELPKLVTVPILAVTAGADRVGQRALAQLRAGEASGSGPLTVVEVPGVRHDFLSRDLSAYDLARAEEAWGRVVSFLKQYLMPPPPKPPAPPVKPAAATPPAGAMPAPAAKPPAPPRPAPAPPATVPAASAGGGEPIRG